MEVSKNSFKFKTWFDKLPDWVNHNDLYMITLLNSTCLQKLQEKKQLKLKYQLRHQTEKNDKTRYTSQKSIHHKRLGPRPLGPGEIDGLLVPPGKACFRLTDYLITG